jgi:hypothetical protein
MSLMPAVAFDPIPVALQLSGLIHRASSYLESFLFWQTTSPVRLQMSSVSNHAIFLTSPTCLLTSARIPSRASSRSSSAFISSGICYGRLLLHDFAGASFRVDAAIFGRWSRSGDRRTTFERHSWCLDENCIDMIGFVEGVQLLLGDYFGELRKEYYLAST